MKPAPAFSFRGAAAVLATMHRKERVIAPLLERALGLQVRTHAGFDTDRFGTFSREIERTGSQLDAARAKIDAALEYDSDARVGLASEGSFGPHPYIPLLPLGREIVVMIDRETGLELIGRHVSPSTNFAHEVVTDAQAALVFAERSGFPAHGLIVLGAVNGRPAPDILMRKDIDTAARLVRVVEEAIRHCGAAFVETDMRAHQNPTRMRAIKRATVDLVRRYRSPCPKCARPGFAVTERPRGLPCSWCGEPTNAVCAEVMVCAGCRHRVALPAASDTADPGLCNACNP